MNYFDAVRDTIILAVYRQHFKNGAFKTRIANTAPYPPILQSFDIMINSSIMNPNEGEVLIRENAFFKMALRFPEGSGKESDLMEFIENMRIMEKLVSIFHNDAKARGVYGSPTMIQTMKRDGTIGEIHFCKCLLSISFPSSPVRIMLT